MTRSAGLILAALAGTASICVVVWFSLSGGEAQDRTAKPAGVSTPPPDIKQGARASDVTIDLADKQDPSRRAGYIRAKSTQQMENRQVRMVSPEVWQFPRSGRLARIVADEADAYIPSEQPGARPERAVLRGNAELRLFDPKAGDAPGTTSIDPKLDHAWLIATTPIIYYDGPLGEVTLPDELDIKSDAFTFRARNATVRFSDAEQRLEFLRIEEAKSPLVLRGNAKWDAPGVGAPASPTPVSHAPSVLPPKPEPKGPQPLAKTGTSSPATPPSSPPSSAASKAPGAPVESFYRMVIESPVTVAQGGRSISADRLEAWVRLMDNKLPPAALGAPKAKDEAKPAEAAPTTPAGEARTPAPAEPEKSMTLPAGEKGESGEAIQITWTGPLEVRPLAQAPAELEGTDIALRFTANDDRLVTFRDDKSGASGSAPEVRYAATPREITLLTQATDQVVRLSMPGSGEAVVQRVSIGITTGRVAIIGPGALQGEAQAATVDPAHADHDHNSRNLTWVEGAEFQFAVEKGQMTSRLLSTTLVGGVGAGDRNGRLGTDRLVAHFSPDPAKPDGTLLTSLTLTGSASLADFSGGSLSAETIDIAFDIRLGGGDSDPALLTAMTGVAGYRNGSSISCDFLQAMLVRKDDRNDVDSVSAKGNISFSGPSAVFAGGDELQATPKLEIVDITGKQAFVGQRATQVNGTRIHIEGASRQITVVGAGTFEHQDLQLDTTPESAAKRGRVTAAWSNGMTFDDLAGTATCDGGVRLVWEQGVLQRDTLDGERVLIWVTPQKKPAGAATTALSTGGLGGDILIQDAEPSAIGDRVLLRATAYGLGTVREKGGPVKVDSRRFAARADGQASDEIERMLYLEGLEIHVDNEAQTLTVPIAGRLFVLDQRERKAIAKAGSGTSTDPLAQLGESSGEALFRWGGSLVANRADGTLTMTKDVSLRHRRLDDEAITELTAATEVKAKLASTPAPTPGLATPNSSAIDASLGQLEWATAKGSAWLANQGRQMQADELLYNASMGEVDATSNEGNNVTLLEPKAGTPMTARRILWNLRTGRIEVKQPGTIVAPR